MIIAGYFIVGLVFPKSVGRYPVFVLVFLLDLYLWSAIKSWIYSKHRIIMSSLFFLYWMPLVIFIVTTLIGVFKPIHVSNTALYLYISGVTLISYAAKIIAAIFIVVTDIIRAVQLMYRFINSKRRKQELSKEFPRISRNRFIRKLGLIAAGAALSGMLIGRFKWVTDFRLRSEYLKLKKLPEAFNGLKIIHFSDLHLGSWPSKTPISAVVDIINAESPDIVLFTGDLVNFSSREAFKYETILKEIKARYGIYAVLGNHDYGNYVRWENTEEKIKNMHQLFDFYKRLGWKLLRNENQIIYKSGQRLAILGVENWGDNPRYPQMGDVNLAMKGVGDTDVKILLSHDPSHWDKIISKKHTDIDLTLSGHTHGFQFGIETPLFRWSPAQYLYKYWAGLYQINEQYIYVNRGTGFLGYPGRIGILPEITSITLMK
ncbi:MAG: metallophosphoesterase [Bacteroidetes bacterium]|nr:metallophosphoesterase [Bacteroidota bacterium]